MTVFDIAIIGAGIAGAGLAAALGEDKSVLLIEAEDHPGYHSTGRSAAFWSETYGGAAVQPLTTASLPYLAAPIANGSANGFLHRRGALHLGTQNEAAIANDIIAGFAGSPVKLDLLDPAGLDKILPDRKSDWDLAIWEAECQDIDVAGLHNAYLATARKNGACLVCRAGTRSLRYRDGCWLIETAAGSFTAKIIVNAAGAWADQVAKMAQVRPLGIQPYRRTIAQVRIKPLAPENLPLVVGLDGSFYFKPEAGGRLWLSPHDEIPTEPCDTAPEEVDIAIAIARLGDVMNWQVEAVERKWAGLRSFAPDRMPVIGAASENDAFFWLAGQGGFGIQTAPAISLMAAALLNGQIPDLPDVDASLYDPKRFH